MNTSDSYRFAKGSLIQACGDIRRVTRVFPDGRMLHRRLRWYERIWLWFRGYR